MGRLFLPRLRWTRSYRKNYFNRKKCDKFQSRRHSWCLPSKRLLPRQRQSLPKMQRKNQQPMWKKLDRTLRPIFRWILHTHTASSQNDLPHPRRSPFRQNTPFNVRGINRFQPIIKTRESRLQMCSNRNRRLRSFSSLIRCQNGNGGDSVHDLLKQRIRI